MIYHSIPDLGPTFENSNGRRNKKKKFEAIWMEIMRKNLGHDPTKNSNKTANEKCSIDLYQV